MAFRRFLARVTTVLAIAAASSAIEPVGASAQVDASTLASCSTYRIESTAANLAIRYAPDTTSSAITVAQKGYRYCVWNSPNGYVLGGRYTACGVSNGNGWIEIPFWRPDGSALLGYTYQACVKDV